MPTLAGYGARRWQRELTVTALTPLLVTRE